MPKVRNRTGAKPVRTAEHGEVSAQWGLSPSDALKYGAFADSLRRWRGVEADQPNTIFWALRGALIYKARRWESHDWQGDLDRLAELRGNRDRRSKAVKGLRMLLEANRGLPDRDAAWWIGRGMALEGFSSEAAGQWDTATAAVERALTHAQAEIKRTPTDSWRFGPLLFEKLPINPPSEETALAVLLADVTTRMLADGRGWARKWANRRRPALCEGLPWAAFSELVSVGGGCAAPEATNLAKAVIALGRRCWLEAT